METYEGRLASFKLQPSKRKVNEAYSSTTAWPHHPTKFSVTPATLAHAGFYHDPTESAQDNVTCVYCSKGLEGWEDGDDALDEHLKRILDKATGDRCPWATVMGVKRDYDLFGPNELDGGNHDPMSKHLVTARKKTFGEWWKFDGKKGWKPTSDRLASAGFYSNPLVDAPDTCACAYCDTQLDGWSKSDDPEEEHRSRRPDCFFFVAQATSASSGTKNTKASLKASTSASRRKAAARDEQAESNMQEGPEPSKASRLSLSTSSKKKVPKKRSATTTSIAEESTLDEDKTSIRDKEPQADEEEDEKSEVVNPGAKSRKSKAAVAATGAGKKAASKATKGKSKAIQPDIIELETESEADAASTTINEAKPPPQTRKRATKASTDLSVVEIQDEPEPIAPVKKTRSTASKSRAKQSILDESIAPSEATFTMGQETALSDAEPSQKTRTTTRAKLAKSTSSNESRPVRGRSKNALPPNNTAEDAPSQISEAETDINDDTVAAEQQNDIDSFKQRSGKSSKSVRSTSSRKATSKKVQKGQDQEGNDLVTPSQSNIVDRSGGSLETSMRSSRHESIEDNPPPMTEAQPEPAKVLPARKTTRSKSTKKEPRATRSRSTRSGHTSDSVSVVSESEASYATQTESDGAESIDEEPNPDITQLSNLSRAQHANSSTPKASSTRPVPPQQPLHQEDIDLANDATSIATDLPDVPVLQKTLRKKPSAARMEAREIQQMLEQEQSVQVQVPTRPASSMLPERPVKALPDRKSRGGSPSSRDADGAIITTESQLMPERGLLSKPVAIAPTKEGVKHKGQSALDALLAGPIPTFDSPEKPQQHISQPATGPTRLLVPTSLSARQVLHASGNAPVNDKTTMKEWIAVLRHQEIERFDLESKKLLAEFDRQTQRKREELAALLRI